MEKAKKPFVSVIMPVYNAEKYLKEAIDSILQQTFTDFELLIFNDGSTDNSLKIINSYTDDRIILAYNGENKGYVAHLNEGIRIARGKYIARMDADDVSLPDRFEKQIEFLEKKTEYIMCGSRVLLTGKDNYELDLPIEDDEIRLKMLYINPFAHSSVMIRANILKENFLYYQERYMPAEDYNLWIRLVDYGKLYNIKKTLLIYRVHGNNISFKKKNEQQKVNEKEMQLYYIKKFFFNKSLQDADYLLLHKLLFVPGSISLQTIKDIAKLLRKLIKDNKNANYLGVPFRKVRAFLIYRFFYLCTLSTYLGLPVWITYIKSKLIYPSLKLNLKFFVKSLLRYKAKYEI